MGVEMSDAERAAFLRAGHTGLLSTLREDGSPAAIPMWFVFLDGHVWLRTLARSHKAVHLRRDPRLSFVVETGLSWAELKAVVIQGTAAFEVDDDKRAAVDDAFATKYAEFLMPENVPSATRRHYGADRAYIRIEPGRGSRTWDNSKIRR
jgi:PPOX class probable F420-dependent enzyme